MKHRKNLLCAVIILLVFVIPIHSSLAKNEKHSRFFYEEKGEAIWEIPTSRKVVAITFDDGPSSEYTPRILSLLDKYKAKATFFVVGSRVVENPEIVKNIVSSGHELANHTYSHPNFNGLPPEKMKEEMDKTYQSIKEIAHTRPKLFRPPGGYYNDPIVETANDQGYTVVLWSWHQDTFDWRNPGVNSIVNKVLRKTRNGDIILFHDFGGDRTQTIQALEQILPELKKRGYEFITVSELVQLSPKYRILNRLDPI
ncbi:polysaccharide deacetylase family protein [Halobacillus sp. BBL2006]|uniref:polysaccharide deacetylase family protein n=1 Tax=Halobacillus sp. BBL2006 TaxID=1543706 RepID=UPI000541F946|nr:polysaccharide deacetylase family protein [Halobacillus sp. BBL2006]KHE68074.1 chitooligosaccharide deacetylase [Halobacillus sp. BBL2006]